MSAALTLTTKSSVLVEQIWPNVSILDLPEACLTSVCILDFVSDKFGASGKFRMLAVNHDCCPENLYFMVGTSKGVTGTGCACACI